MGSCCVKQELTDEDIHFLKKHTRYDEETIREWYAGFLQVKITTGSLLKESIDALCRTPMARSADII